MTSPKTAAKTAAKTEDPTSVVDDAAAAPRSARKIKADPYLSSEASLEAARAALEDIASAHDVGEYLGLDMIQERVGTLRFACLLPGYVGWSWAVTVARVPRGRHATVSETELLPGPDALLSPSWVPWVDRLRPGDLGPGDTLPRVLDDPRLDEGYTATGDKDADQLAIYELGLGRPRVLSAEGRAEAAQRWYEGAHGPTASEAIKAGGKCATCGFVVPLGGSLRLLFGICTNQWAARDGSVVSYDHGCGAHSETDVAKVASQWPPNQPMIDDSTIIPVDLTTP
ncbi:MAG: DUF3027 domain-containing protein [Bifidobacteriaceae bacterium]|nr:DUF3027 domain-containing protein [Bifidobacteriaceae bacterium]